MLTSTEDVDEVEDAVDDEDDVEEAELPFLTSGRWHMVWMNAYQDGNTVIERVKVFSSTKRSFTNVLFKLSSEKKIQKKRREKMMIL